MRKILSSIIIAVITFASLPFSANAAGGIYASGGGAKTVGQTFTVTVAASGATFDTIHGAISVSGPVSVSSFSYGDATWMSKPSNGGTFDGAFLGSKKTSFTIATIKLKATGVGSGAVSVSGASLKNAGTVVGSGSGGATYTISKALVPPGQVEVSSTTHPDQNTPYEATTIALAWTKASGVTAFSYLLDQAADTTPAATATSGDVAVSYPDKAVGIYYFHIRAQNADGWGGATHFKINIKEPDPKINEGLSAPSDIKIEKDSTFVNDVEKGTVSGLVISGTLEAGFTANITLTPAPTLPEEKLMTAVADSSGKFSLLLDFPIVTGFHTLSIQGQQEKVLTPVSNVVNFEITQSKGGGINILSASDATDPVVKATPQVKGSFLEKKFSVMNYLAITLALAILVLIVLESVKYFRRRQVKTAFK